MTPRLVVTAGAVTSTPLTVAPFCFDWIRVAFIPSAGSGTMSANMQMFGA